MDTKNVKSNEQKFQHYTSSRQSMRMITEEGRKVTFVNYEYMTCEQAIIDYLDMEIGKGLKVITKGEMLTSKEADPMEALKTKHIKEYLAAEMKEAQDKAVGITKSMGNSKSKEQLAAGSKPLSTTGVTTKDSQ